ncbi:MAG: hypothetical protein ACRDMV_15705 [Streptosporangiales bacterium]
MTQQQAAGAWVTAPAVCDRRTRITKSLLGYGVLAGPVYVLVAGTPEGAAAMSRHGLGHLIVGAIGFMALIAAGAVFARRFTATGQRTGAVR